MLFPGHDSHANRDSQPDAYPAYTSRREIDSTGIVQNENSHGSSQTASAEAHLPAVLGKRDLTVFMLLIVLFVANNNGAQIGGPATFLYWTLGLLTFLIPCAYVSRWLARRFPGQGAPYLWAIRILGERWSFFSAFCAWLPGVLATVSVMQSGLIFARYLLPTWFTTPTQQGIAIVLILLIPTLVACLPLIWLKRILTVIVTLYVGVFFLVGIAGISWLWSGHPAATALNIATTWQPTGNNFAVFGVIILAFLGVDIPLFMGGEIRGGKEQTRRSSSYVWWGSAITFVAYVMGTFGIMVVVPASESGGMAANIIAIRMVFGPQAANATAVVLAASQIGLTIGYLLMFSRLLVVLAQDRRLPVALVKTNRHGVPVISIITQAMIVAVVTMTALVIVPALLQSRISSDDLALAIYSVLQAGTTVVWVATTIQLFVFVLWFLYRRKESGQIARRERILLVVMSCMGITTSLVGIWATVSSSWLPTIISNGNWSIFVLGVSIASFAIGLICSELPHVYGLLSEQQRVNNKEVSLRAELQDAYDEQQILVQQQQELLAEVDRLYRQHAQAAVTDAVTDLPNHRAVIARIEEEVSRCQRSGSSCAVIFVDLDHFKKVNDTWGHRAGDVILHEVGRRLRTSLRTEDFVGRYGGEEFAIILSESDLEQAYQAAERLRVAVASGPCLWYPDKIERPEVFDRYAETAGSQPGETSSPAIAIPVTASIGIAVYQMHGTARETLVEYADRAMYQAKRMGRNQVCIADLELTPVQKPLASLRSGESMESSTLQALTATASAHDRGTDTHSQRLVRLAEATAHVLNRPDEEVHLVRLSALLHDIGKIGIPDAILHKPGPLTDEEWTIMRCHPEIGQQILEQVGGVFRVLASIVVAHHERWDGHGYPKGLAKEAIPMGARILAVVDAYDTMVSGRPYREPVPQAEALAELVRCAGHQFDPQVVAAFRSIIHEQEGEQRTEIETSGRIALPAPDQELAQM